MANFKLFGREINTDELKKNIQSTIDEASQAASEAWDSASESISETSAKVADTANEVLAATGEMMNEASGKVAEATSEAVEWLKDEENQEMIKNSAIDTWIKIDEVTDKVDAVLDDPLAQKIIPAPVMGMVNIVRSPITITKHIVNNYVVTEEVRETRMEAKMSEETQLSDVEDGIGEE